MHPQNPQRGDFLPASIGALIPDTVKCSLQRVSLNHPAFRKIENSLPRTVLEPCCTQPALPSQTRAVFFSGLKSCLHRLYLSLPACRREGGLHRSTGKKKKRDQGVRSICILLCNLNTFSHIQLRGAWSGGVSTEGAFLENSSRNKTFLASSYGDTTEAAATPRTPPR